MKTYKVKVWPDGSQFWYKDGKHHREDGPAIIYSDGRQYWYLNGKEYSEEKWKNVTSKPCNGKVVEIDGVKYKLTLV
jgi:hypothetical protein